MFSFLKKKKDAYAIDYSDDNVSLKSITEDLYKQNLELAYKNKTLSLLRQLYQISLLTLEPAVLGKKVVDTVQKTLEFELIAILMLDADKKVLKPLTFAVSERVEKIEKEKQTSFNCDISDITTKPFLTKIITEKTAQHSAFLRDVWAGCMPQSIFDTIIEEGHIKTVSGYPLIIEDKVVGVVAIAHNRAYDSLSSYEQESIGSFVDVIAVALNKAFLYKDLQTANEHLKELDRLKSEFVSLATHQIRAPLTAIKGYLSEIFEGDFGPLPPDLQPPLNTVMQSNENLINIVGDFLNISRIEQGRMAYEFSSFDLGKVAQEVGESLKPNISNAHLDFSIDVEAGNNYLVSADIGKTKQIIGNLIDNAVKYTPKGWIKLRVLRDMTSGLVRVEIKDSGVGVTTETMPKLFQKFSRATDANKTNVIGTGLGLYVVKTMVEAQHGKVWVESEGAGKGSTFIVEFPAVHVS